MKTKYLRYCFLFILIISAFALIVSCGPVGGGEDDEETEAVETTPAEPGVAAAAFISLATSQTTVQSDNSDSATITATVLDANRAVIEGLTVSFSADGGQINASSVLTDQNGQAQISFSAGTASGGASQLVTITAEVEGLGPVTIPIQVVGTSVVLSTDNTNIIIGDPPVDLTVHVQDFSAGGIPNVPVTLSVSPAGLITLSATTGNTDLNGELVVQVTGDAAGSVTVTAEALTITDTLTYTVGAAGTVFGISSPTNPWNLDTNTDLTVTVDAPGVTNVIFATTLGTWDGGVDLVVTKPVALGQASAVLNSPIAGVATVQVIDANDPSTKDSLTVAISAPPSEAAQISLQASPAVVAPSYGDISNTVTLEATVKNASLQEVGNAPVAFSIVDPTGGGESISPVIAFTGPDGIATSTFTSGTLSSDADGITVQAFVVGTLITDSVNIVIGGTAGSVVIGRSTKVSSISGDTAYSLPMSVLVADTNGNPVPGAVVSLSAWPAYYYTGYTGDDGPVITGGPYANEDLNKNLYLDPGEDVGLDPGHGDGALTPPNAAAGTLPGTVTTDENGVANFELVYLKSSAVWIDAEITASTIVYGTETSSTLLFGLPFLISDKIYLPDSPYGYGQLSIIVSAGANGSIDPPGPIEIVDYGDDLIFSFIPDFGYDVEDVVIDGMSMGVIYTWSFLGVNQNHTVSATFIPIP